MNKIIILIFAFALFSCEGDAISTEQSNNSDYKIEFLFEHNGCKVYRFYDGRYVYWTDCKGKTEQNYTVSSGKSHRKVEIQNETIDN